MPVLQRGPVLPPPLFVGFSLEGGKDKTSRRNIPPTPPIPSYSLTCSVGSALPSPNHTQWCSGRVGSNPGKYLSLAWFAPFKKAKLISLFQIHFPHKCFFFFPQTRQDWGRRVFVGYRNKAFIHATQDCFWDHFIAAQFETKTLKYRKTERLNIL